MSWTEPSFPPLLSGRCVVEGSDPLAEAVRGARSGELGAGDALWAQDDETARLAIVLEPDDPLAKSAHALLLAMAAAGDCIGALTPPQVGVFFRWPGTILVNGAAAGEVRLVSAETDANAVPDWMVVALELSLGHAGDGEPGHDPDVTTLGEEGCDDLTTADVLESYSRHFCTWLNTWQNDGLVPVSQQWRKHVEGNDAPVAIRHAGETLTAKVLGLDEDGNLVVKPADGPARSLALLEAITPAETIGEADAG